MGAAVVFREQLDVLVVLTPVHFVLDAVVGKVNLPVEVRQIVLPNPFTNLVLITVGPAVTVGPAAVVRLQEFLVLAL